jgi:uncharacterized protein
MHCCIRTKPAGRRRRFRMTPARISVAEQVSDLDWADLADRLDRSGFATTPALLKPAECRALVELYGEADRFRSRIVMERHGFGRGEYKYFAYPLPPSVAAMREAFYARLAPIANWWREALGESRRFPLSLEAFLAQCHGAGQRRPTPLMLKYGPGDYNRLHQDLYGDFVFPLQLTFLLSAPGQDFAGGEFVLSEQRPRTQSRVEVVQLAQGQAVIFAVHNRPLRGTRGFYRANLRHGVSTLHRGERYTLGIIFHDAA